MTLNDFFTIMIPSLVTIIGFMVTSRLNKRDHSQSTKEIKLERQLSDLYGLQQEILQYVDMLSSVFAESPDQPNDFKELQYRIKNKVFCAGSEDAVKLIAYAQHKIYSGIDDGVEIKKCELIAVYVLLSMQIKYDTTGIKTSPKAWYIGKYTTLKMLQSGFYNESVETINNIVDDLGLNSFLRVDKNDTTYLR